MLAFGIDTLNGDAERRTVSVSAIYLTVYLQERGFSKAYSPSLSATPSTPEEETKRAIAHPCYVLFYFSFGTDAPIPLFSDSRADSNQSDCNSILVSWV